MDEFYQKLIHEPEFRNCGHSGLKCNVMPAILTGNAAEEGGFRTAAETGIRLENEMKKTDRREADVVQSTYETDRSTR